MTYEDLLVEEELEQLVREAAYYLWEDAGKPETDGIQFWLEAETKMLGKLISLDDLLIDEDITLVGNNKV